MCVLILFNASELAINLLYNFAILSFYFLKAIKQFIGHTLNEIIALRSVSSEVLVLINTLKNVVI